MAVALRRGGVAHGFVRVVIVHHRVVEAYVGDFVGLDIRVSAAREGGAKGKGKGEREGGGESCWWRT